MIGFAPFEEPPVVHRRKLKSSVPTVLKKECTECNYIVLFFVVGVMMLALGDSMKK
jgi:hypothetical protein